MSSDPVLGGKMKIKAKVMRTAPQIYVKYAHLGGFMNCMEYNNPANLKIIEGLTNVERCTSSTVING